LQLSICVLRLQIFAVHGQNQTRFSHPTLWLNYPSIERWPMLLHTVSADCSLQKDRLTCVAMTSAIETRFRSPPETPRTYSFPTIVSLVCDIPSAERMEDVMSVAQILGFSG
jgi:hypothetical protein